MKPITSFPSLLAHLEEAKGSYAQSSLQAYFFKQAYTGSSFEAFCDPDPYRFTANDLVAVSMLSVNIPSRASRWILKDGQKELTKLLTNIKDFSIEHPSSDLTKGHHAWNLWNKIYCLRGVGETKASKLLVTKRPQLFPIYDKHVAKALQLSPDDYWQPWQSFMRSEDGIKASKLIKQLAESVGKQSLSALRLLDIVIWMQQHGHKYITKSLIADGKMICVNYADPN